MNTEETTPPTTDHQMPNLEGHQRRLASQEPSLTSPSYVSSEPEQPREAGPSLNEGPPESLDALDHQQNTQHQDHTQSVTTLIQVNELKRQKLLEAFSAAIATPRFWAKESRYYDLLAACTVPMFDDRSLQQYYNHAKDDLLCEAAEKSNKEGVPAVMPTEDEIRALAWERYSDKQMALERKALQAQRKKEAETTGTRPVKVTDEEVKARVEVIVAALRRAEGY